MDFTVWFTLEIDGISSCRSFLFVESSSLDLTHLAVVLAQIQFEII
jgi:hypothetical protein